MPEPKEQKTEELLLEARNFFNYLKKDIGRDIRTGKNIIYVSFQELASFSPNLSELIILSPEQALQILEVSLEESGLIQKPRVRLKDLPLELTEKIRNLRAKHLNHLVMVEGIVRLASEVRPQVVNARFECPSCGTIISVLQTEAKFREPTRCSCGRKGQFKLISKEMVDAQRLVIEESPENLTGGEQPRRITVWLREDLVEPKMEDKTTPGSRVQVIGTLNEITIHGPTGSQLVRYDIAIEANNIIPLEESFEDLNISEEDERQIRELSVDPRVFQKLGESIAPSIYGYEEIKQAIVLQLFGGVKKTKSDGTKARGDTHILLVGDPGVAKSVDKNSKMLYSCNDCVGYDSIEKVHKKFGNSPKALNVLSIDTKSHQPKWSQIKKILKHAPERELIKVTTEHGKEVIATQDHSFICLDSSGNIAPMKGEQIDTNTYLPIPINFHKNIIKKIKTDKFNSHKTNSRQLPDSITLDEDFGFFMGIFLSEGYIMNREKSSKTVIISNNNKEIKKRTIKFIKKVGLNFNEKDRGIWISSVSLSNLMDFYCYNNEHSESKVKGNLSRRKCIPSFACFSPIEFIRGLLSGLFSGDGRFIKDKKRLKGIELITVSKDLAEGTSDLLFCAGFLNVVRKTRYNYKGEQRSLYKVRIPFSHLSPFLSSIKFYGRNVLDCPEAIYSYNDLIPCGKILYSLIKKAGFNKRIGGNRTLAAEMRTVRSRNKIGRIRLKKILKILDKHKGIEEFSVLNKIANSHIVWSKVEKIDKHKKNGDVYDLFIPETNTFCVNGIGVHNSQMLKFISGIAPKGRYVVGKSASGAGLTATVVRDEFLKGWSLEAGAMVLSNKGMICIDEIEKMDPNDRSAMHEALEQQCYLPDLKITLADNSKVKIGEFVERLIEKNKEEVQKGINCEILSLKDEIKVLTTDFESIYPVKIDKVSRHTAPEKFVRISLANGRNITVTPEHPCWTAENGKITTVPAKEMTTKKLFPTVAFGKIRWSRIKSVEIIDNADVKYVYDLMIDTTHSFISNNMILHNSVTISKANVQATLRAETSVLAAGNPKFGRFDPYQTVASQIDIPPTLINRFDVVFIMKDIPDRARDEAIANHVLAENAEKKTVSVIERDLFRKYIAYAKQKIIPKLTDEAIEEIKKFYVDLRNAQISGDTQVKPLPISARQLDALIRMSEASAKSRLSEQVTKDDAKRAIALIKYYLMQVGYDYETKTFDIDRIATGVSSSQRGKIMLVKDTIAKLESRLGKLIPTEELTKELEGKMDSKDIDDSVDKLTISGDIFHPRKGFIQRM